MHAVLLTSVFEAHAKAAGLTEDELMAIVTALAMTPLQGDLIPGTGGVRKVRFRRQGGGKSGGYRTYHFYAGDDVPLFLLGLVSKGQRADLNQAERNAVRQLVSTIADVYRAGTRARTGRTGR
jgi:hypothetical protein